jgi:hypothetical protein
LGDRATAPECDGGGDRAGGSPLEAVLERFGAPPSDAASALSLVARLRDGVPGPAAPPLAPPGAAVGADDAAGLGADDAGGGMDVVVGAPAATRCGASQTTMSLSG